MKLLMVLERLTGEDSCFLQFSGYRVLFDPFRLVDIESWWDEEDKGIEVDMGSSMGIEERNTDIETDN